HADRILPRLGLDLIERTVDDCLGNRLLALVHHRVHEFRQHDVPELRVRVDFALFGTVATRHRLNLTLATGDRSIQAFAASRGAGGVLLGPLGAVLRAALATILHTLRVEHAADDVVAHARQILDAAAADHD